MVRILWDAFSAFNVRVASLLHPRRTPDPTDQHASTNRVLGALLDAGTSTLLTVTNQHSLLLALNELIPGTVYLRTIRYAQKPETRRLIDAKTTIFAEWQWSQETGTFVPAHQPPSNELRARAALAHTKRDALALLYARVNALRISPADAFHESALVYLEKRNQALAFKATGYDNSLLPSFPYVEQYAAIAHRTPRQAADEIIFQARLRDDVMQKSEAVRLRFLGMIRDAQRAADLDRFNEQLDELTMQVLK